MTKSILCYVSILALVTAAAAARADEQAAKDEHVLRGASSVPDSTRDDCETGIRKLDASQTEGEERLAEKNGVIPHCASQYKGDKTIERFVKECDRYEEAAGSEAAVRRRVPARCL